MTTPAPYRLPSFGGMIGVAREDITPPVGIYNRSWGAAKHDVAEGIHRPLTLTCLTFQTARESKPLVLIGGDLGWWKSREDEFFIRGAVLESLALDPVRLMFCLSHTHAGPSVYREDAQRPGGGLIEPYLRLVRDAAIRASRQALASAVPATLTWRYGRCDLATNRDLRDPNKERYLVGLNPAQPADDALLVGRVSNEKGRTIATLVNYACHPTTLAWENRLISPDYVGAMRHVVEAAVHAPSLFLQGASGELAPAEQYSGDTELADGHGQRLGYAVLSTLESMLPPAQRLAYSGPVESGAALALWKRERDEPPRLLRADFTEVELPLKPMPTLAQIEEEWRRTEDRVMKERLWRRRGVRKFVGDGTTSKTGLWGWRLGDALLFGQPNEAYSTFQLQMRRTFSPSAVAVMNVVNGYAGYLPPRELYGQDIYTVWVTPFDAGSLEMLTQQATRLGERLRGAG